MPLYEYECKKCGHRFEKIQKFSDRMVKKCPVCGGKVEQMISAPAVQFKGSGWYVTDYAKKPASGDGDSKDKKDDKTKPDASSKDSSSSDGSKAGSSKEGSTKETGSKESATKESSAKESSSKDGSSKESSRKGAGRHK